MAGKRNDYYLGEGTYGANSLMTSEQARALYKWLTDYGMIDRYGAGDRRKDFSMGVAFASMKQTPDGALTDHKMLADVGMDRVHLTFSKAAFEQLQTEHPALFQMAEQDRGPKR